MHGCAIRPRPGCPSSFAGNPCGDAFDIGPTIRYLHAALQQAVSLFNGDPDNVVITGWRGAGSTRKRISISWAQSMSWTGRGRRDTWP